MKNERTTDLQLLRKGHKFTWGIIVGIHDLGPYTFVEYEAEILSAGRTGEFENKSTFSVYRDGKSTNCSYGSIEEAMLGAVASRLEPNEARWMAFAASKVMGLT